MMEGILRVTSSMSASWVSWVMLVLLVLLAFNRFFITDLLVVFRGMFSRSERLYLDTTWQGRVMAWLFRAGVIAMAVYLLITRELGACNFVGYLVTLGLIGVYLLVQYGLQNFVCMVFLSRKQKELVFEQRGCICNAMSFVLWSSVLIAQWVDDVLVMRIVYSVVVAAFIGLLLLKAIQLFHKNVLSILYVLVSILSLEVVPLLATVSVIKNILQ